MKFHGKILLILGFIFGCSATSFASIAEPLAVQQLYMRCYAKTKIKSTASLPSEVDRFLVRSGESLIDVAVYMPPNVSTDHAILYFHGNGEVLNDLGGLFVLAKSAGFALATFDYPCYGRSTGRPTERSTTAAALSAMRALAEKYNVTKFKFWADSLGSAVAIQTFSQNLTSRAGEVSAMVLVSPWDTFQNVCIALSPLDFLCSTKRLRENLYRSIDVAPKVNIPTMLVYSYGDQVVGSAQSERLFQRMPVNISSRRTITAGGHNEIYGVSTLRDILHFLIAN